LEKRLKVQEDITKAFITRDASKLYDLFTEHRLDLNLEYTTDTRFLLQSRPSDTPEARLYRAAAEGDIDTARTILESEPVDIEHVTKEGFVHVNVLGIAVKNEDLELTKLLLKHGADVNAELEGNVIKLIELPIINGNIDLARVLLDAGAPADIRVGLPNREPMAIWAVRHSSMEMLKLVVERGSDPAENGINGWTALSDAIVAGKREMIDYLVEVSDPQKMIYAERRSSVGLDPFLNRTVDYRWFPRSNALFFAREFGNAGIENLEQRLLDRAEALGGSADVLDLSANSSAASLAYHEEGPEQAMAEFEKALGDINITTLTTQASGDYVSKVMSMLTDLHELRVINGLPFDGTFRDIADHIISIGGSKQSTHDMLDVIQAASKGDPSDALAGWKAAHGNPNFRTWNFALLNEWVEQRDDSEEQARIHDVLDFFELPGLRLR